MINPGIIPPHPHPNFCSSSYYTPLSSVVYTKEAEKRRHTRINSHLDKLLRLLHCNLKMDKATLLAMVVQRKRELKRQTSDIIALGIFPSESDEIYVLSCNNCYTKEHLRNGQGPVFKASFCCEDRSDLLPDLIEVLNSLHLKVQKAELSSIGGRIRNVLFDTVNKDQSIESIQFLQNSLKTLLKGVACWTVK